MSLPDFLVAISILAAVAAVVVGIIFGKQLHRFIIRLTLEIEHTENRARNRDRDDDEEKEVE